MQSSSAVQSEVHSALVKTLARPSYQIIRVEIVLFNFPVNIMSRPVFWLYGELGGGKF